MTQDIMNGLKWAKSSYSSGGANCVERAVMESGALAVRDSKDISLGAFVVGPDAWQAFIGMAKTAA
ncbi:DUF397 domain-containing protein [Streptomyces sp. NPDC017448]|uniref:DUF397 domain-containing protein n=1 Tax=Streptomyces sp. NPDC017448 TaxID=3364996 RepID=UPI0037A61945